MHPKNYLLGNYSGINPVMRVGYWTAGLLLNNPHKLMGFMKKIYDHVTSGMG